MANPANPRAQALVIGAGQTKNINGDSVLGFLCKTSGTLSITRNNEDGTTTLIVDGVTFPVGWTYIPFYLGVNGGSVTSGTAVGTLAV